MRQILRAYQAVGLTKARLLLRKLREENRRRRLVICAPTGAGKTTIASHIIEGAVAKGGTVLFLAHRKELIDQASERIDEHDIAHGVIMAGHHRWQPLWPVQVASVQTLVRRLDKVALRPTIVVVDECHHARADTYAAILDAYPDAIIIGLTATPWRSDGRGLGELFEEIVVVATPAELVELWKTDPSQGLVPLTGFAYDAPSMASVKVKKTGDYDDEQAARVMLQSSIVGNVLEQYALHAYHELAVGFAVTIEHSRAMTEQFCAAGIRAEHLDGTTQKDERRDILLRLKQGVTRVVWNVGVLTEGWDCPPVSTCLLARPTKSLPLYMQMVGRVRRPSPGKLFARLHDHAGAIMDPRLGHPDAARNYELTYDPKKEKLVKLEDDTSPLRRCSACCAIYLAELEICPNCGHQNVSVRKPPRMVDGIAVPIEVALARDPSKVPESVRRTFFFDSVRFARKKGFKKPSGWAQHRYKEKFLGWPPKSWVMEAIK